MKSLDSNLRYVTRRIAATTLSVVASMAIVICTMPGVSFAASSNEKVVLQGRIVDSSGTVLSNSHVTFDIQVYSPTTGVAGSHCLLFEETQILDMSASSGTFVLQVGTGTRVGTGPTLRETFTNATVTSFGALTCGVGTAYTPGAIDDRSIEMTVSFAATTLTLAAIPVKAVPYAFQANQIGGYGINNIVRLNGVGSATNLNVDQFNYLTGFFHDNNTSGTYTDDYLNAQSLQIKNLLDPTAAQDAATKLYVDTAISGVSASLPALNSAKIWVGNASNVAAAVTMSGDGSIDNTGKLTVSKLQGTAVATTTPTTSQVLQYNGTSWAPAAITGFQSSTLSSGSMWIGNASNVATAVVATGDISNDNAGSFTVKKIQGVGVAAATPTSGQVLEYNGTAWTPTAPTVGLSTSLSSGHIFVGNASNIATDVAMSGDTSITSGGVVSVDKIKGFSVAAATPTTSQVLQYNGTAWAPATVVTAVTGSTLTSANIWVGNASNTAQPVTMTGDASLSNAGSLTLNKIQGSTVAIGTPTTSQVLQYNGSAWVPATITASPVGQTLTSAQIWVGNAGNTAQPVTMTGDASLSNAGSLTLNTVPVTKGGTGVTTYTLGQVPVYDGTKLTGMSCSTGEILRWDVTNGFVCSPFSGASPVGSTLTAAQIWVGNSANIAAAVGASGDVTLSNAGAFKVTALQNFAVSTATPTTSQVLQYNGTAWTPTALSATLPALATADIWVGNGSSVPTAVAPTGDVSMTSAGTFSVDKIKGFSVAAATPTTSQVLQYNGTAWTPTALSTSPVGQTLTSTQIWVGNASNTAQPVVMTGDASLSNAGSLTVNKIQGSTVAIGTPTTSQVLQYNGTAWAPASLSATLPALATADIWVGNGSSIPTAVAPTGDVSMTSAGTFSVDKIKGFSVAAATPTTSQVLQYNGTAWTPTALSTSPVGQTLTSAQIWVGNASNTAQPVAASGDVTLANTGAFKVTALQNFSVAASTPTTSQVLQYNGTAWAPASLSATLPALTTAQIWVGNGSSVATAVAPTGDVSMTSAGTFSVDKIKGFTVAAATPTTSQVLQYNGTAWTPTALSTSPVGQTLTSAQIWVGNASNTAQPVAASGDVTLANTGAFKVTALQNFSVAASTPTTSQVLQYNGTAWAPAALSTSPVGQTLTAGQIWVGNASNTAQPVAASGDVTLGNTGAFKVTALQNFSVAASTPTTSQVLQYNGTAWAPAALSTSPVGQTLTAGQIWVGNASNVAAAVVLTGDATISNAGSLTLNTVPVTKGGTGATTYSLGQVPVYDGTKLSGMSCSLGQTLVWDYAGAGTGFGCGYSSATGSSLASANIWVGNSSAIATAVVATGDVSLTNAGSFTVNKIQGSTVAIGTPTTSQVLQYNGTAWAPASLSATLPSLASANIWVGNGSAVATAVVATGDVSVTNAGSFTLNKIQGSTVAIGTPTTSQVLQYNGTAWAPAALTAASPVGATLTSGQIWMGNTSNLAVAVTPTGDVTYANTGSSTVAKLQGTTVAIGTPTTSQVLQYNGTAWAPAALSATLPSLTTASIWVGNGSSVATAVAPTGDVSMTSAGTFSVDKIKGFSVAASTPTTSQVLQYNGTAWTATTLTGASPVGATLTSTQIWVGNASNTAQPVTMAGDASLSNAGSLTVNKIQGSTVAIGTPTSSQVLQYNGTAWAPATLSGLSPVGATLTSAQIWVGNASNTAQPVAASGDVTLASTGAFKVTALQNFSVAASTPTSSQVLQYNGTAWAPATLSATLPSLTTASIWVGNGSSVATAVAPTGDVSMTSAGTFSVDKIKGFSVAATTPTTSQVLQYNGTAWAATTLSGASPVGATLTSAQIWVGNASNLAQPVAASGDVTLGSTGAFKVTALQNFSVAASTPTTSQVLQYNGTAWAPAALSTSPVGQTLTSAQIWVGNAGNTAQPVTMAGDASMTNAGSLTVNKIQGSTVAIGTPTTSQVLQYNGTAWAPATIATSVVGSTLTSAQIWVGNAGNTAQPVAASGDVTLANTGAFKVTAIQNIAVTAGTPTTSQVLQYNGTSWVAATYSGPASGSNTGTTISFAAGNVQYTTSSCGAMTLNNMKDGATYTLAVQGTTAGTCVFTAWTGTGTGSLSVLYPPDWGNTTSTYQTLMSFVVVNSTVYVAWVPGYHP